MLFSILPTFFDIGIAIVYFVAAFNLWYGLIVASTMFMYMYLTVRVTEWRTKYRRTMNKLWACCAASRMRVAATRPVS